MLSVIIHRTLTDNEDRRDQAFSVFSTLMLAGIELLMVLLVFALAAMVGGIIGSQSLAVTAGQIAAVGYIVGVAAIWAREVSLAHRA